jgi:hypothetical protein
VKTKSTLRSSIEIAEKIQETTFTFDEEKSKKVLEAIRAELKQKENDSVNAEYRGSNYRFNL